MHIQHHSSSVLMSYSGLEAVGTIANQILDQKAICQQDPDQDEEEEAPEDQAEYDSMLISSAGDLVAALAYALGSDFTQGFSAFFPLISKYYVSAVPSFCHGLHSSRSISRKRTGR